MLIDLLVLFNCCIRHLHFWLIYYSHSLRTKNFLNPADIGLNATCCIISGLNAAYSACGSVLEVSVSCVNSAHHFEISVHICLSLNIVLPKTLVSLTFCGYFNFASLKYVLLFLNLAFYYFGVIPKAYVAICFYANSFHNGCL